MSANLLANGFSMGASNYLSLRSDVERMGTLERKLRRSTALRHGSATYLDFLAAGLEMLLVEAAAAAVAYGTGWFIARVTGI